MIPYRGSSSSHSRWGGDGHRERTMNTSNMSRDDLRRNEMETRAQDWERDEQTAYPSRHYDKHYRDDPDKNLQNIMKDDMNRKSRLPGPREQERGFDQDYRNERGHSSLDRDERRQAYERDDMNRHKEHHRSNSRWEPKANMAIDPRLDPRRSQQKDTFRQPNSESRTSPWREDFQNYQTPKDPRWQGATTSTKDFHQPDRSSNMNDKDMRLHPSTTQVSGSGKPKYDMARPSQHVRPPPPIQITDIPSSVPSSLPTATLQGKQKSDSDPLPFNESRNHSVIPSQLPHSSHMPTKRQSSVPASHSHPHAQPFFISKSGPQKPPYRSDHFQPKERNLSPHMSPAHLSSRESSFSPPPTSGDVDMRLGAPKSVPLSAVSKTDLSLIRKALASLKTGQANKGEQPTESAKGRIVEDEYDPEAEWKTSQSTSNNSKIYTSDNKMSKALPQKEKLVKHNLMAQDSPPLPPTLHPQPPAKSISPSLPPEPTTYSLPPPKPPTFSNAPLVLPSASRPTNSFKKDSVPIMKSIPTSLSQSIQHSKNKDCDPTINNTNKSDMNNTKSEKSEPSKTVSNNKDQMLEFLNIGLTTSKKPSQSVIPGSLGDLLLKAKSRGVSKDQPTEVGEKSEDVSNQNITNISSTENKSDNMYDRKDQSSTPDFQQYIETSKNKGHSETSKSTLLEISKDSKLSVGESKLDNSSSKDNAILERSLYKEYNQNMISKPNISGFEKNLLQEKSHTTKIIPLQKSVGLSQFEKSRLFGHRNSASPPPAESQTKVPLQSSDQDDLTLEPMQIDEDDSNDAVSQSRDPRMRKDEDTSNIQSQDPRLLARSSGDPSRGRDPRMMSQMDPRMDNQGSVNDFIPVNDPRRISNSHRDPRQAPNFGNRDPRSQRTDPRLMTHTDDNKHHSLIPPSPRYETDTPSAHKFTKNVPPQGFNPTLPPPNYSSGMKSHSGPDHRLPPPMPSYGSNITPSTRPNMGISHPHKGNYMKDPRKISNQQVRQSYDPAASRSNWPQQQFPVTGGVGINRSFFPQRSDVPSPGPPQSPPMHSQVNDKLDADYNFTCLLMKGLPFFANSRYIYHFFEEFLLLDQIIEVDYKYQCKGNAYIRFSSNPVAKHAFTSLNGWLMNGHQIILKPLTIGFFNQAKNTYKAKSTERENNLGLPEMPRGNANPYYKQRAQKPPSPPPSAPEPYVPSTQEASVSSTDHNAKDKGDIKHHAEYKDPHKKIDKSFKVPKIKKNYDSSIDPPKKEKVKKEGLLKKYKEHVSENKSKKHDVTPKERKKRYKKVIIESETSSSEEEYELSDSGSTMDDSDNNEDKLVMNDGSKMKDKIIKESKVSKSAKFNKPMPKSMKEKLKLKKSKSSHLEKENQDKISFKKEKEQTQKNYLADKTHTDSADETKASSNEPKSDSSSESEEKEVKESKTSIECESPTNDEGDDEVQDESNVEGDDEVETINILSNTKKGKKKVLNKKSSITHSKVKRMKQNALPSKKKIAIKKKKAIPAKNSGPITIPKHDLSDIFDIVCAPDYVLKNIFTSPIPEEYLIEHEITQQQASFITVSKVKKIKQKSLSSMKKTVIKKNKAQLAKSKEPKILSKLDLSEVFDIVLASDYIPEYKCESNIPVEYLKEHEMIPQHASDESVPEKTLKPIKKTKPVSKKRKKVVKINSKPEKILKKRKTRSKPTFALEPEKPAVLQSSWRSQKLTMTEESGRKKVRVTIPLPQRMMIQLPTADKTAMIKMRMTKTVKQNIATSEDLDLEETYAQDGFYSISMEEDSEDIRPQGNIMEGDSEVTGSNENSMEVDSQDVGPQ